MSHLLINPSVFWEAYLLTWELGTVAAVVHGCLGEL